MTLIEVIEDERSSEYSLSGISDKAAWHVHRSNVPLPGWQDTQAIALEKVWLAAGKPAVASTDLKQVASDVSGQKFAAVMLYLFSALTVFVSIWFAYNLVSQLLSGLSSYLVPSFLATFLFFIISAVAIKIARSIS